MDERSGERLPAKSPRESAVEINLIALPYDANPRGFVLGGHVMHQIDLAAAMCAVKHSRREVVTASMDDLHFRHPIRIGDFITLQARLAYVGRTSMEILVRVLAETPLTGDRTVTTTAHITFVALDGRGAPTPVPQLLLETDQERELWARAEARRAERLERVARRRVDDERDWA